MARIDRTTLARRIKARRLELGLTQREVAGNEFTRGFISQIENGLIDPSLKSLEIVARHLGTSVNYFLEESSTVDPVAVETAIRRTHELIKVDLQEAADYAATALSGAEQLETPHLLARAQSGSAWVAYYGGDFQEAARLFQLSADSYRLAGSPVQTIRALNAAGSAAHRAGDYPSAAHLYTEALELMETLEEPATGDRLRLLVNLGLLLTAQGESAKAISFLGQALDVAADNREYYRYGEVHTALGVNYRHLNQLDKAIKHYREATAFHNAVHQTLDAAHATLNSGNAYAAQRDFPKAREALLAALSTYEELGETAHAANARADLAKVMWYDGNLEEAERLSAAALEALTSTKERGRMLVLQGKILAGRHQPAEAAEAYATGLELLGSGEDDAETAEACYELGNLLLQLGKAAEASIYLKRAAASYRDMKQ